MKTLRDYYSGNVTLFQDGEHDEDLIKSVQKEFGVDILYDMNPDSSTLVRKIEVSYKSPYDYSALIDADMVVVGKVDELMETAKNFEFVATQFADWKSNGGTISRRILRFKDGFPEYMDAAIKHGPAINTGVYAWPKNSPFFKDWLAVAKYGESIHTWIPDEIACQILLPRFKTTVLPAKFNVSVKYDPSTQDKRIIHMHGKKHVIELPLCKLWIDEFKLACEKNLCNIIKYSHSDYGDRRLKKFFLGKYGWDKEVAEIKAIIAKRPIVEKKESEVKQEKVSTIDTGKLMGNPDDVTIVTACDPKYVEHLKLTYPNWIKYKKIEIFPMIVYINGFKNGVKSEEISFLTNSEAFKNGKMKIIEWDFPTDSQREKMLSAFVLGTARDVKTKYWVKVDADAFCIDNTPLLVDEMLDCEICGHKWGYTKPVDAIEKLDKWALGVDAFKGTKPLYDPKNVNGSRYGHSRIASYVQFHKSEFVRLAAKLAGERLPIPSHDTYLWYIAERLGMKWLRRNFKRYGFTNTPKAEKLKRELEKLL
jgi:hypothetical protein